jgi:hypothetical protein
MLKRPLFAVVATVLFASASVQAFDHGIPPSDVLRIMEQTKFSVVHRSSAIPLKPLVGAKFLPSNRPLRTFLVDPGQPFQSGTHTDIDPDRPQRELIFAALSPEYIVLYFWIGDWPADVRYMMVISCKGSEAKQIFYCTVDGEAKTLADLQRLLRKQQVSILGVS